MRKRERENSLQNKIINNYRIITTRTIYQIIKKNKTKIHNKLDIEKKLNKRTQQLNERMSTII